MYKSHQKIGAIRKMANGGMIGTEQAYDRFANMQLDGFADVADGYADGGLIGAIKRKFMGPEETMTEKFARQDAERAAKAPQAPVKPAPAEGSTQKAITDYNGMGAMKRREAAAGLAKGGPVKDIRPGGKIEGPGTETSDDVPLMGSNGEFMIKAKAVEKIGVPALEALNAIADKPGDKKPAKAGHGAVRKMATGGLILGDDGVYRVNSAGDVKVPGRQYGVTNPRAATPVSTLPAPQMPPDPGTIKVDPSGRATAPGQQYRLGGPATPTPGTALVTTGPGRSFTPPTIPNPQVEIPSNYTPPQVNSKTGAYTNVPPVAEPPAAAPQAPSRISAAGAVNRMNAAFTGMTGVGGDPSRAMGAIAKTGQTAVKAAGRLAAPLGVINEAVDVGKVAVDPNASGIDVATQASQGAARLASAGVGAAAGAAAGSVIPVVGTAIGGIAGGLLGYYGANKAIEAGRSAAGVDPRSPAERAPSLVSPAANAAPAPAATPAPGAIPATPAATVAPVDGQVIRIGNSYSGTDVSGDISLVNGKGTPIDGRGGTITAQNNLAAENLARKYGQTSGFGPQGAIRGGGTVSSIDTSAGYAADLKALAEINDQKAKQEANIQAQERYAQDNVLLQRALGGNRYAAAILQGRTQDRTVQRGQDIQAGASRESAQLARQKLALETTASGIDNQSKTQALAGQKQLADAQAEYLAAGDDPVKLKAAERKLITLGWKQPQNDKGQVISLPDTLGDQGQVVRGGQAVLMPDGRIVRPEQKAEASPPPTPAVQMLKQNPSLAAQFDAKYGPGASKQYLTQK